MILRSGLRLVPLLAIGLLPGCAAENDPPPAAGNEPAAADTGTADTVTADAGAADAVTADAVATDAVATSQTGIRRLTTEHLPNAVQVHPRVISGGLPEGDAGFRELSELGVKTVICVDGAKPDVEIAARHGLRYVHLPHGYDGIPESRARELAKAVRELEGAVYIHCHHGRHRSPAAASVACVTAGLIDPSLAVKILELAGTSPDYRGLYRDASEARPLEAELLAQLQVEFRATAPVPPMADAMVQIGHTHDHLGQIAAAGWKTPADHPDLVPAHEALLLQEHFTELLRTDDVRQRPEAFRRWLEESETAARTLSEQLRQRDASPAAGASDAELNALAGTIAANCKACHRQYRNQPLSTEAPDEF